MNGSRIRIRYAGATIKYLDQQVVEMKGEEMNDTGGSIWPDIVAINNTSDYSMLAIFDRLPPSKIDELPLMTWISSPASLKCAM